MAEKVSRKYLGMSSRKLGESRCVVFITLISKRKSINAALLADDQTPWPWMTLLVISSVCDALVTWRVSIAVFCRRGGMLLDHQWPVWVLAKQVEIFVRDRVSE